MRPEPSGEPGNRDRGVAFPQRIAAQARAPSLLAGVESDRPSRLPAEAVNDTNPNENKETTQSRAQIDLVFLEEKIGKERDKKGV